MPKKTRKIRMGDCDGGRYDVYQHEKYYAGVEYSLDPDIAGYLVGNERAEYVGPGRKPSTPGNDGVEKFKRTFKPTARRATVPTE